MIGIIGSGFGLYGYLPAVAATTNEKILIVERYKEKFYNRPELFIFENNIQWVKDLNELIESANCVILSVTPAMQASIIKEYILGSGIKNLILEKPVDVSPQASIQILKKLEISEINFRIGYTLRYTDWVQSIINIKKRNKLATTINIYWSFLAFHYRNNISTWKRNDWEGGGVLRFYGIHFIALSCLLNYDAIERSVIYGFSEREHYKWDVEFRNSNGDKLTIQINSFAQNDSFRVRLYPEDSYFNDPLIDISQKDPFTNEEIGDNGILDHRIGSLQNIYKSLFQTSLNFESKELYNKTNQLWLEIERLSSYVID
jgi:predicted dehydrogenase